jgi:signal transduction histidine kinase/ActR/RegA family two-component response regulator
MPFENDPKGAPARSSRPPSSRPAALDADLLGDVLDALEVAVLVVDPLGAVIYRNREARGLGDIAFSLSSLAVEAIDERASSGRGLRVGERHMVAKARPLEGRGALIIVRDVTDERAREAVLFQSEKLASIGLLSAGIGHEINNPAAFVLANLRSLDQQLDVLYGVAEDTYGQGSGAPGAPLLLAVDAFVNEVKMVLAESIEGMNRIHAIARDLRAFTRGDDAAVLAVDVNAALESALLMLRNELRYRARVERALEASQRVRGNPGQLGQVFLNLILNAAQAVDEQPAERNRIQVRSFDAGSEVVVEISDNGPGISPAILPRIFDPLFTTKPSGVGTGLGLPIAREIVHAAGGELSVESASAEGTTFRVRLPALTRAPLPAPAEPRSPRVPARRARILAIDDEVLLLTAYRRVMRRSHDLETAAGGREALAILEEDRRFDVILCDLLMPYFSGMDLYREVASRWPDMAQRFVFLTGGAFTLAARRFLEESSAVWIEKPVDLELLLQVIAERVAAADAAVSRPD